MTRFLLLAFSLVFVAAPYLAQAAPQDPAPAPPLAVQPLQIQVRTGLTFQPDLSPHTSGDIVFAIGDRQGPRSITNINVRGTAPENLIYQLATGLEVPIPVNAGRVHFYGCGQGGIARSDNVTTLTARLCGVAEIDIKGPFSLGFNGNIGFQNSSITGDAVNPRASVWLGWRTN